jgi:hypothetical protein
MESNVLCKVALSTDRTKDFWIIQESGEWLKPSSYQCCSSPRAYSSWKYPLLPPLPTISIHRSTEEKPSANFVQAQ